MYRLHVYLHINTNIYGKLNRMPKVLIDNNVMKDGYSIEDMYKMIWKLDLDENDNDTNFKDYTGECVDIVRGVCITLVNVLEKQITKIK